MINVVTIILTKNESLHIARAVRSARRVSDRVLVVDSGSEDETIAIALEEGADVLSHEFVNHSLQFQWAVEQVEQANAWILRLDADEVLDDLLIKSILEITPAEGVVGFEVDRYLHFMGEPVRFGGVFPMRSIRLFKKGFGNIESRWMDEHIVVLGSSMTLPGKLIDDNLKSVTWWVEKHNGYASREAIDVVMRREHPDPDPFISLNGAAKVKRLLKQRFYYAVPTGIRSFSYFLYRFFCRLGFLDSRGGKAFHVLQGLWYRYLVDVKVREIRSLADSTGISVEQAIWQTQGIRVWSEVTKEKK